MVHADAQEERENAGQRRLKDDIGILEDTDSIDAKKGLSRLRQPFFQSFLREFLKFFCIVRGVVLRWK